MTHERFIRKPEIKNMLGISSNATLDAWEREIPGFPKRRRVGGVVAWLESEVVEFLRSRPAGRGRVPEAAIAKRKGMEAVSR